jgi:hypothetical protein
MRWLADTLFRGRARRRAAELDTLAVARCQKRILRGLVHQARTTSFGRAHDFRRIRTTDDFQRLVPLSTPAGLRRDYWEPSFPQLAGTTWPGPLAGLVVSARPAEQGLNYLPVSPGLLAAHHAALRTALALGTPPRRPPFRAGLPPVTLGYVGREPRVIEHAPSPEGVPADTWDSLFNRELGAAFQAALLPLSRPGGDGRGNRGLRSQAEPGRLTGLVGAAENLTVLFERARQETGCNRLVEIWPRLALVLSTSGSFSMDRNHLRRLIGSDEVLVLEAFFPPEGPIAVLDPRHDLLRLLPDHEVFFEFVPQEELAKSSPVRHGAAEVEPGVAYGLALTSPAGLWACLTGTRLCFERRDPPLLRWLEAGPGAQGWWAGEETAAQAPAASRAASAAHPLQPPHPRNGELAPSPAQEVGLPASDRGDPEARI